jgi:hypothetical protein
MYGLTLTVHKPMLFVGRLLCTHPLQRTRARRRCCVRNGYFAATHSLHAACASIAYRCSPAAMGLMKLTEIIWPNLSNLLSAMENFSVSVVVQSTADNRCKLRPSKHYNKKYRQQVTASKHYKKTLKEQVPAIMTTYLGSKRSTNHMIDIVNDCLECVSGRTNQLLLVEAHRPVYVDMFDIDLSYIPAATIVSTCLANVHVTDNQMYTLQNCKSVFLNLIKTI